MNFPKHVQELLEKRYFLKGEPFKNYYGMEGKEDWPMLCKRVARTVSKNNPEMEAVYSNMIYELEFLPNSPTLFGAGVPGICLSACFIAPMEDSIEGWANTFRVAMKIQTAGGGIGFPLHKLRPSGSPVRGKIAHAAGPIEFMRCWNQISKSFMQAVRNGANMGQLHIGHSDTLAFLKCKDKDGELSSFNISLMIPDEFMECVKNDLSWDFKWNDIVSGKIRARELWNMICEHAWKTGEPGITFYDRMQRGFPGELEVYSNPCGEANLPPLGACNLGSINLMKCLDENGAFSYQRFEKIIRNGYMFLDDLIDVNQYPTPEIDEMVKSYRQIGLGTMGLADLFVHFGMVYGSPTAQRLTHDIFGFKQNIEKQMNEQLAKERGVFPKCTSVVPLRNANCSTQAPTGTTSMIAGVSASIEPIFSFEPIMRMIDGIQKPVHEQLKHSRPEVNVCANDLSVKAHVEMTGIVQKYIDMSISKTINLPNNATVEDVKQAFTLAFENGLKGVTVYRDGCRANQTIQTQDTKDVYSGKGKKEPSRVADVKLDSISPRKRPSILSGKTFNDKISCGHLFTTINFDNDGNMMEVFISAGKGGGCKSNVEALSRLISIGLRSGIKVSEIQEQLKGIICPACIKQKDKLKFTSCADSVSKAMDFAVKHRSDIFIIKEKVKEIEEELQMAKEDIPADLKSTEFSQPPSSSSLCPECGNKITMEAGCRTCKNCGWSRCG